MDHGHERGWHRYGFDNQDFDERPIHGSDVPIGVRRAFFRGVGEPHVSFGIIPPNTDAPAIGMHIHRDVPTRTDVEEWYIIVDGRGVMTFSSGDDVEVGPGDMVVIHPGTGHSFQAVGDVPVRLISITPTMYTSATQPNEVDRNFTPRIDVTRADDTMNPLDARCTACGATWTRPSDDRGANTLAPWARDHACKSADDRNHESSPV
ncbi:MAG TPA: cupin domain-containing protein [Ilumatobacteraceae bacterium]|nr:cupin domain-containing protein [Ilumatobacteraceae bacterium]